MLRLYCKSIYQGFHKWMGSIAFHDKMTSKQGIEGGMDAVDY